MFNNTYKEKNIVRAQYGRENLQIESNMMILI